MTLIIKYHYTGIRYDVCHLGCHVVILLPSVVMLNVVVLSVTKLNAFMPNVVMLNVTAQ